MIIAARYDEAAPFYDGVAEVGIDGNRGYIDKTGNVVVPLIYEYVWGFNEGLTGARIGEKYGFINRNGNITDCPIPVSSI
ncbi:MAG: WG repeat-containing protein [Muribaculaceae bacterium]|nr:WG repeat-containing protein [Muribaculaceae bacterium]